MIAPISVPFVEPVWLKFVLIGEVALLYGLLFWSFLGFPILVVFDVANRMDIHRKVPWYALLFLTGPVAGTFYAWGYSRRPLLRWSSIITLTLFLFYIWFKFHPNLLATRT